MWGQFQIDLGMVQDLLRVAVIFFGCWFVFLGLIEGWFRVYLYTVSQGLLSLEKRNCRKKQRGTKAEKQKIGEAKKRRSRAGKPEKQTKKQETKVKTKTKQKQNNP